jgi:hypothetical protein
MPNLFLQKLKQEYPKSWAELELVSNEIFKSLPSNYLPKIEEMPFELVFGIILRFFKENELEFDYNNLAMSDYDSEIETIFSNFEQVISHYS